MVAGIELSADIVQDLLRRFTPPKGRILVAGSADAGMLALTAEATRDMTPAIEVADRCPTPLTTCQRYADMQGISFASLRLDIRSGEVPRLYDVMYGDCVLQFVPRPNRVDVLSKLRRALMKRGVLILVERLRTGAEESSRKRDHAVETLAALAAGGIVLPEDEASFRRKLDQTANERRDRLGSDSDRLTPILIDAGFRMRSDRQVRTGSLPNGESVTMQVVVASPA